MTGQHPSEPPVPSTEAGAALLDGFAPMPLPDAQELHRRSAMGRRVKVAAGILAIEAEAREAEFLRLTSGGFSVQVPEQRARQSASAPPSDPAGYRTTIIDDSHRLIHDHRLGEPCSLPRVTDDYDVVWEQGAQRDRLRAALDELVETAFALLNNVEHRDNPDDDDFTDVHRRIIWRARAALSDPTPEKP